MAEMNLFIIIELSNKVKPKNLLKLNCTNTYKKENPMVNMKCAKSKGWSTLQASPYRLDE